MDLAEVGLDDEFSLDDEFGDEIGDELDDSWLKNYSIKEEIFNKFYKDTVKHIKLYFFYIDSKREIIKVLKQKKDLSNNVLYKDEISKIVNENRSILNKKFILSQIVKYNFNIENNNINKFINNNINNEFLTKINEINDIYWDNTIPFFSSLNSLYFLFYEKNNKNTKKIFLKRKKKSKTKKHKIKELQIKKSDIIKID